MPEPVVELLGVTFRYPAASASEPVLEDVALEIAPDDFLGVIGPNGGGKTTLLKVILGLVQAQHGTVRVFGSPPHRVRQRIGYVPQHAQIDPSVPATVLDVVLAGRVGRSSWGCRFGRVHHQAALEALEQTETRDLAGRPIGTLSGGQRQRVLIARALAAEPELLLLDEPTAGVDPHVELGLTDLLHRVNQRLPIVLVSHDVSFVSTHLKRIACLNRRLVCHRADEVSAETIAEVYHDAVRAVAHGAECALADPGCDAGCQDAPERPPNPDS
jgi:zinc transport system ATP-binding protein